MKKFISGFIIGALVCSLIGVLAASYVANPVDFKVLVNGEEFVSDPPALEVEGRTYLPLRAMGNALGVDVEWNEELRQAEVGDRSYYNSNDDFTLSFYDIYKDVLDYGAMFNIEPVSDIPMIAKGYAFYEYQDADYLVNSVVYRKSLESLGYEYLGEDNYTYVYKSSNRAVGIILDRETNTVSIAIEY